MTWKDKLELGLKEDAPCRKNNLPATDITGPNCRQDRADRLRFRRHVRIRPAPAGLGARPASSKPYRIVPVRSGPPKDKV